MKFKYIIDIDFQLEIVNQYIQQVYNKINGRTIKDYMY